MSEEINRFKALLDDIVLLREKHGVTWEYLAEFVTLFSKFGWEIGTAQSDVSPSSKESSSNKGEPNK